MRHVTCVIYSLEAGGAERVLAYVANYLSSSYRVTIVTLSCASVFYPVGTDLIGCPVQSRFRILRMCKRFLWFKTLLKQLNPDLVISFTTDINIAALCASQKPTIVSERNDPYVFPSSWIVRVLRKLFYRKAHFIVCQTQAQAAFFNLPTCTVIPNPVYMPSFYKKNHSELGVHFISIGRLDPQKNQKALVQAFKKVVQIYPYATLTIYGDGPLREELVQLSVGYPISFPGLTLEPLQALMQADVFVFPSAYEGFPNALAEAMSVGLPVIATNVAGSRDIVPYPCIDLHNLADEMLRLIPLQSEREARGLKGREAMRQYENVGEIWEDLVRSTPL